MKTVQIETSEETLKVKVEIVSTTEERNLGLMHRESLDADSGMFFVWEDEEPRTFWMKNTLIPLDMIFISADNRIVNISKNSQPCAEEPCERFRSIEPAQYVLEVNAGFSDNHNIKIGDKLVLK